MSDINNENEREEMKKRLEERAKELKEQAQRDREEGKVDNSLFGNIERAYKSKLWTVIEWIILIFIVLKLGGCVFGASEDVKRIANEQGISTKQVEQAIKDSDMTEKEFVNMYDSLNTMINLGDAMENYYNQE
ncbi:MAG: hypothetical protein ACLUC0_06205 [Clostridium neonatale]|uniref:hypothetical protein n=1 Tax=Clostridium neonatale TaxID=137838 RepID=UPI00291B7361|nr:hypothetical protein [Clostridium neonatale]CAI3543154.1 hypothetical protein CNEO3_240026 [Clostridium neonatale]